MGTRSITKIMEGNQELCRIYRQYDGYPKGHGVELALLCRDMITNGCGGIGTANGMSELAARIICALKTANPDGNIYLEIPRGPVSGWAEFIYTVRGKEKSKPTIECRTHQDPNGPSLFNPKQNSGIVFNGSADEWLAKYQTIAA